MPKVAPSNSESRKERRHNPLGEEYDPTSPLKQRAGKRRKQSSSAVHEGDGYIDSRSSKQILELGQDLAAEDDATQQATKAAAPNPSFSFESRFSTDVVSDEDEEEEPGEYDDEDAWGSEEEVEEIEVDPNDLDTFNRFNPSFDPATLLQPPPDSGGTEDQGGGTNLTELILEKIAAHEAQQEARENGGLDELGEVQPDEGVELPPKVIEAYGRIAGFMSRYKSGKLPKPFKVLPTLPQWDILLQTTRPEAWTPNAVYEATKLFSSSPPAVAQGFNTEVLLPRVREDIYETKKLNVHLYKALKKALYKPACFFRGIIFPLVDSGTCTLREATIVSSVITRYSIPALHSAVALNHLCEIAAEQMRYDVESAGACNIFIRTLIDKRYALPTSVVDALVVHFMRFKNVKQSRDTGDDVSMGGSGFKGKKGPGDPQLPVLWHQGLLAFAQRYKNDLEADQREALMELIQVRGHKQIGPEVRRELLEGRNRDDPMDPKEGLGGDDTMIDV